MKEAFNVFNPVISISIMTGRLTLKYDGLFSCAKALRHLTQS